MSGQEPTKTKRKTSSSRKSKAVSAIPKGFHTITPYLTVNNGSVAIEFYKRAFGAREMLRHSTPDGKILNAQLRIGDSIIMLSDEFPGSDTKSPVSLGASTVTLHVYTKDVNKLWDQATAAGAKIVMPLNNQFWGERYGQLSESVWPQMVSVPASENERRRDASAGKSFNGNASPR